MCHLLMKCFSLLGALAMLSLFPFTTLAISGTEKAPQSRPTVKATLEADTNDTCSSQTNISGKEAYDANVASEELATARKVYEEAKAASAKDPNNAALKAAVDKAEKETIAKTKTAEAYKDAAEKLAASKKASEELAFAKALSAKTEEANKAAKEKEVSAKAATEKANAYTDALKKAEFAKTAAEKAAAESAKDPNNAALKAAAEKADKDATAKGKIAIDAKDAKDKADAEAKELAAQADLANAAVKANVTPAGYNSTVGVVFGKGDNLYPHINIKGFKSDDNLNPDESYYAPKGSNLWIDSINTSSGIVYLHFAPEHFWTKEEVFVKNSCLTYKGQKRVEPYVEYHINI